MNGQEINDTLARKAMRWTMENSDSIIDGKAWFNKDGQFVTYKEGFKPWTKEGDARRMLNQLIKFISGPDRIELSMERHQWLPVLSVRFSCTFRVFDDQRMGICGESPPQPTLAEAICLTTLDWLGIDVGEVT